MIDGSQWAKHLLVEHRAAVKDLAPLETALLRRFEVIARRVQLDAIEQALRLTHQTMNGAPRMQAIGIGRVVDALADLALDVEKRLPPSGT